MTSFGWGQRQCLGQTLTQDELVVACGALAWAFNLKPKVDPVSGKTLPVPVDKSNSLLIIRPDPFAMAFEPRSEKRKEEALRIWAQAEAEDRAARESFLAMNAGPRSSPIPFDADKREGLFGSDLADGFGSDLGRREREREPERTTLSLDRLEQLKRDILIHIKSVPDLHADTAPIINRANS
jgi:hypothetical protein